MGDAARIKLRSVQQDVILWQLINQSREQENSTYDGGA